MKVSDDQNEITIKVRFVECEFTFCTDCAFNKSVECKKAPCTPWSRGDGRKGYFKKVKE